MTNYEHYKEKIKKITNLGLDFAVNKDTQEIKLCADFECKDCLFTNSLNCSMEKFKWSYEEYIVPDVDWSKVPVDTKIWVREGEDYKWHKRHFSKYEENKVYAWDDGGTSFTSMQSTAWKYVKLAEVE